jgi:hypothetical protein
MKLRKRDLVAVLIIVALGSAVYRAKFFFEHNKRLELLVVQAVSSSIKGSFQVGRVRFGFLSAHLNNVKIQLPAQALSITVDDIRVNLSVIKLFRSGFSIARSIGKIVLVSPAIEFSLAAATASKVSRPAVAQVAAPASAPPVLISRQFAAEYLLVKNGVISLKDRRGKVTVLGKQLQGRLWDTGTELNYKLTGRLGASRENLFVNGRISWRGENHHLSLQLEKAEIRRPLVFKDVVITGGSLTGVIDLVFPDTVTVADIESKGWVRINNGTFRVRGIQKPLNSVNLSLSVLNTRITIDSLSGRYACASLRANGTWDIVADRELSDRIDFQCRDLWLDSLGLQQVRHICRVVGGGWLKGSLERKRGADAGLTLNGGGVTLWGTPLLYSFAHVKFEGNQVELDSLSLYSPASSIAASGIVDYSKPPIAYGFKVAASFDSLACIHSLCRGKLRCTAVVNGVGGDRSGQLVLRGKNISYSGIPLGHVAVSAEVKDDSGTFSLRNQARGLLIKAHGSLRRLFTDRARAVCSLSVTMGLKNPLFTDRLAQYLQPDSMKVNVFFNGWRDTFYMQLTADAYGRKVKGGIALESCRSSSKGNEPAVWKLEQHDLVIGGFPSACTGSGRLFSDALTIDSLVFLNRAVIAGKVGLNQPYRLDAAGTFAIPLKNVVGMTVKGGDAVESGRVYGVMHFSGNFDNIESHTEIHLVDAKIGGVGTFQTDATIAGSGSTLTVLPVVVRKDGDVIAMIDTLRNAPFLKLSGKFDNLDLRAVFGTLLPEEFAVDGKITGSVRSSEKGFPIMAAVASPKIAINEWQLDSLSLTAAFDSTGVLVSSLRASDGPRTVITATGFVPMSLLHGEVNDTDLLKASVSAKGDIIATLHHNLIGAINGSGNGSMVVSIDGQPGNWHVREGSISIPKGTVTFRPYLRSPIKDFSCAMTLNDSSSVTTVISGVTAGKRSLRIFSTHEVPAGYEAIKIGPLDIGILQLETPQHGLDIHLPGFMQKGETGDLEPVGKNPFRYFSLADSAGKLTVVGLLLLRDVEFTYPLLEDRESPSFSPQGTLSSPSADAHPSVLSLVNWAMDIKPADRKVMYFRDISGNKTSLVRFLDAYIDQGTSVLHLCGCDDENTLKISGMIKAYHGAVYYGKIFDRNFEAGLEFIPQKKTDAPGYDNRPILWGSAEAYSDTSRFDRVKLTALVQDSKTGTLSERGRLVKGKPNVVFRVSSDFEELPGESEREFYRQAGLQFLTLGSAGKFMSDFGEQNLHRIFLQRFERKLAKFVGLDIISIETSVASNYFTKFYNRQFDNQALQMQADYLALANAGVTIGHYIFNDMFFIKARGGLLPLDTALTPQYSFGLEFQPTRFLFMDFDYGFYKKELAIEHNPRVNLQLRLPISGIRNLLNF